MVCVDAHFGGVARPIRHDRANLADDPLRLHAREATATRK
jgi:hypothetical protein